MSKDKKDTFLSHLWLFIPGAILLIYGILMGITYQKLWQFNAWNDTGQIGDTIGGMSSPVMGLIGAILVYKSFEAQRDANKIQSDALEEERSRNNDLNKFNQIVALIEDIKVQYESFEIKGKMMITGEEKIHIGIEALKAIRAHFSQLKQFGHIKGLIIQDDYQVQDKFSNFTNLIIYTSENIIQYPYDPNSRVILTIKYKNCVSDFESMLDEIATACNGTERNLSMGAILQQSSIAYAKVKEIKSIETMLYYELKNT